MKTVAVGGVIKIPFKNENIYAKHVKDDGTEEYVAMVPDLIAVLDTRVERRWVCRNIGMGLWLRC